MRPAHPTPVHGPNARVILAGARHVLMVARHERAEGERMTGRTRTRIMAAVVLLALAGGLAGAVAVRLGKRDAGKMGAASAPVALQFTAADVAYVEDRPLARWL